MMIHPATAHFAMVLPVVATVFGLAYMVSKTETMAKISARTALAAALAMIGAWYTGNQAGPDIYNFLSAAGKEELLEHKQLGLYLAIAMSVVAVIQILGCRLKKAGIQMIGILLTVVVMAVTFLQGKHGGEIVYEYGEPFTMTQVKEVLADDELSMADDVDEVIETIKKSVDEISKDTAVAITGAEPEEDDDEDAQEEEE